MTNTNAHDRSGTLKNYDLSRAADRALRHVEVSFQSECSPAAFAEALERGRWTDTTRAALTLFLAEGDEQMLLDLVTEGSSTFNALGRLCDELLPADHPTGNFLKWPSQ